MGHRQSMIACTCILDELSQLRIEELIVLVFLLFLLVIVVTLFHIFGDVKCSCSCSDRIDKLVEQQQNVVSSLETRNSMTIQNTDNENRRLLRVLESIADHIIVRPSFC